MDMKTKVNKVPLVGPRGRRELLDKIEELEKKVSELESEADDVKALTISNFNGTTIIGTEKADFCSKVGISVQQYDKLLLGEYTFVKFPDYDPEPEKPYFYSKYTNNVIYFYRLIMSDPNSQTILSACASLTVDERDYLTVLEEY